MENREAINWLTRIRDRLMTTNSKQYEALTIAIATMEKQEQNRWISVTDRLPEKDCKCRVTEGDFKSVIDCYWSNHKKQFEVWSYYNDCYMPITNVTAWKPIEEPYTEEDNDKS